MRVDPDTLLSALPPFSNRSVLIHSAQDVSDIISEVLDAHTEFAKDYDLIYPWFYSHDTVRICRELFDFCKYNIFYTAETENRQTTKSPSAIIATARGDCKHFAGMIGGIIDAISRNTGKKISWCYRFASYDVFSNVPGHVFIVVSEGKNELWIDPTLKKFNERLIPFYSIDKKVKGMALYRVSGPPGSVGFIDPATIMTVINTAMDFINIFGGDKVPNYPVKTVDTFKQIKTQVAQLLPLPPKSVDEAKALLEKASELRQEAAAMDQSAPVKTYILLYEEIMTGLANYINAGGGQFSLPPAGSGLQYYPQTGGPAGGGGMFPGGGADNSLLYAAGAGVLTWFLTKKIMFALAGAAGGYIIGKKVAAQL